MDITLAVRMSGFTQVQLAAMVGMDKYQFNKKLRGWNGMRFTPEQVETLRALGGTIAALMNEQYPLPVGVA